MSTEQAIAVLIGRLVAHATALQSPEQMNIGGPLPASHQH